MVRTTSALVLAFMLTALAIGTASGQAPAPGCPPTPPIPARPGLVPPVLPFSWPAPQAGPPACAPFEDSNGNLLAGDPLLDGPGGAANLGWGGSIGIDLVKPVVQSRVNSEVQLGTFVHNTVPPVGGPRVVPVVLPFTSLAWNVIPRFELGYRFGQGAGEVLLSYRFLTSSGSDAIAQFDAAGAGTLASRVNLNIIDIDYASHEFAYGPLWDLKWRAGVRIANIYTETRAAGAVVQERATDAFTGAGPHLGLDVRRKLPVQGLSLYGRADTAFPIGPNTQMFQETQAGPAGGTGFTQLRSPTPTTSLGFQLGLNYYLTEQLTMTAGYSFEHFWDLATFYNTADRSVSIGLQGAFFRAEWKY
jgi:hypothetical protein